MENNTENNVNVQGAETKRKPSASYTIKQFGETIKKLNTLELVNEKEIENLQKLHKKVVEKFIGIYMEL